jgi:transcriptional regulator with XRE-family HTH domain
MTKIKPPPLLADQLGSVGEFIAAQRRSAELSLRQLAEQTGVSNPYLSQIERGLRRPSAEVLQQLAKALRVSAETLYVRAGMLDPTEHSATTVEMAVLADSLITERQRRVLIDVYTSFVKENASTADIDSHAPVTDEATPASRSAPRVARRRSPGPKVTTAKAPVADPAAAAKTAAATKTAAQKTTTARKSTSKEN